jgi:hypothetical protein
MVEFLAARFSKYHSSLVSWSFLCPGLARHRRTGNGIVDEDDWPRVLQLLDKGVTANAREVAEREEEDELYELGNFVLWRPSTKFGIF